MKEIKLNSLATFICVVFCLILITACNSTDSAPDDAAVTATIKTGSGDPYYFAQDIDEGVEGITVNYSVDDEGNETYELVANWVEYAPSNMISLGLTVPGEGTYQGMEAGDDYGVFIMTYIANQFEDTQKNYSAKKAEKLTVTLTEVSENHVKGTFSGTLSSKDGEKVTIEDGKFDLTPKYRIIE